MATVAYLLVFAAVAVAMEGVAWLTHKYVMHGFLWVLHADHHRPKGRGLQRNDAFGLFFSLISIALIATGTMGGRPLGVAIGAGMALYGMGYVAFHDIMFHRRIRAIHLRPTTRYLRRIVNAHRVHHRHGERQGATSFSFLYAPRKYDVAAATGG